MAGLRPRLLRAPSILPTRTASITPTALSAPALVRGLTTSARASGGSGRSIWSALRRLVQPRRLVKPTSCTTSRTSPVSEISSIPKMSLIPPPAATRRLKAADGPLVWIDCEMTGLDIERGDRLLEIACIVTDGDLNPLDAGVSYVIHTPKHVLDNMNDWCVKQHGSSGLTAACQSESESYPHASVRAAVLAYVRDRVPTPNTACLAGNTVHADKVFLVKELPELVRHLHYRIVDVSSIKELAKRWYGPQALFSHPPNTSSTSTSKHQSHRALYDIQSSIAELSFYRTHLFKPPPSQLPPPPHSPSQ